LPPPAPGQPGVATAGQGTDQDPKKKKGILGKIAGIFKDDKTADPPPKPPDSNGNAPH
jgi:hypothetical protein